MTRFGYVAAACGLAGILSAGAVAVSRAQQPGDRPVPPALSKQEAREHLIRTRTEVELSQIEHDAARIGLIESLSDLRKLHRDGLSGKEEQFILLVAEQFQLAKDTFGETELSKLFDDRREGVVLEVQAMGTTMEKLKGMDGDALSRFLAAGELRVRDTKFRASIEEWKATFTRRAADLIAKTLDRDEAEIRYKAAH